MSSSKRIYTTVKCVNHYKETMEHWKSKQNPKPKIIPTKSSIQKKTALSYSNNKSRNALYTITNAKNKYPPTPACKGERALRRVFGTTRTTTTTSTLTSTTRTRTKTRRRTRTRTTTRTTTTTTPAAAATTTTTRPKWGDVWYTERPVHVFPF